jgi:hypothetical protein
MALAHGSNPRIVYMDFDHLLRWIENDVSELDCVLKATAEYDCAVIGRGPHSFAALPERLASTEAIVNHVYHLMTSRRCDDGGAVVLTSGRGGNRQRLCY